MKLFGKRKNKINELETAYRNLKSDFDSLFKIFKEQDMDLGKQLDKIRVDVDNALNKFRLDMTEMVAERYFKSLEEMFRWNKEFSFLESYINSDPQKLGDLRRAVMRPILNERIKTTEEKRASVIDDAFRTRGELVISKLKELKAIRLELERKGKTTDEITTKIDVLEYILNFGNGDKKND